MRISGNPTSVANATASSTFATAAEAAVGTPADRNASFIDGLSRHSHVVRTEVPGMLRASRTRAAVSWWDSMVDSSRSTQTWLCAHSTAAFS